MERTLPPVTPLTQPWFDGCARGELLLQHCSHCGEHQFYPRILCSHCGKADPDWATASGRGHIASFSIVRRGITRACLLYTSDAADDWLVGWLGGVGGGW